ncbi:Uncharacterised protein [Streptococcus pyogenes]|nr:Uncharacterised protein [Streptococcus pyogenes]
MGEWIEIDKSSATITGTVSHPSWVSGLKSKNENAFFVADVSHPSWVSGLKFKFLNEYLEDVECLTLHG